MGVTRRLMGILHALARKVRGSSRSGRSGDVLPLDSNQITGWDPVGKWAPRYRARGPQAQGDGAKYGGAASYQLAAVFLEDCEKVEDWGCGFGTFRRFCLSPTYVGIDGSDSPAADVIADLREYRSETEGILLRHVLEHNSAGWRRILSNAVESFTKKMVLVIYTPFGDVTRNVRREIPPDTKVPVAVSFRKEEITGCIPAEVSWFTVVGEPLDEFETIFFLKKGARREAGGVPRQDVNYRPDFDGSL